MGVCCFWCFGYVEKLDAVLHMEKDTLVGKRWTKKREILLPALTPYPLPNYQVVIIDNPYFDRLALSLSRYFSPTKSLNFLISL